MDKREDWSVGYIELEPLNCFRSDLLCTIITKVVVVGGGGQIRVSGKGVLDRNGY